MDAELTINWNQANRILENSSAIVFEDTVTYFNNISTDDDTIEFLPEVEEDDSDRFIFNESDNKEIKCIGSDMWLKEENGEEYQITILAPTQINTLI